MKSKNFQSLYKVEKQKFSTLYICKSLGLLISQYIRKVDDFYMKKHFKVTANRKSVKASNSKKRSIKSMRDIKASYDAYTENLADFGMREIEELRDILDAWLNNGLPDDFYDEGVKPAFNRNSGYVFLVNDDYQVCMEVDGRLESFYTTPYNGYEGFFEDLLDEADESWEEEDIEYLRDIAENRGDDEAVDKLNAMLGEVESEE